MLTSHRIAAVGACLAAAAAATARTGAVLVGAEPCPYPCKATAPSFKPWHDHRFITVKFVDGLAIRAVEGELADHGTGILGDPAVQTVLATHAGGRWERMHRADEKRLDAYRAAAIASLGKPVADLNLYFLFWLPEGRDPARAIAEFNTLTIVEMAGPSPRPAPLPVAPDYRPSQLYLNPAFQGINAKGARLLPGGDGTGTRVVDCEYSFNALHTDLPAITVVTDPPNDPFGNTNHGTAVLGQMVSRNNGAGTTGGAYGATAYFAATQTGMGSGTYNLAAAITDAMVAIAPGDVILIEQQLAGPNYTGVPEGTQFGLVPGEWLRSVYDAIVTAVGSGHIVVEAAGNGSQNLDAPAYATGNGGHWPFLAENDSGAIIVGAGAGPYVGSVNRARLDFSNYGATVDLQGQGEYVVTTGYGDLFSADGVNSHYTGVFNGTSSASPIVATACILFSSIYNNYFGTDPTPALVRSTLVSTGWAQTSSTNPSTQNIGPRPDLLAALHTIAPAPANNHCASATPVRVGQTIGSLLGASRDGPIDCGASAPSADVWYEFTGPGYPVDLTVTTCGTHDFGEPDTGIDTIVAVLTGCGGSVLGCNNTAASCAGDAGLAADASVTVTLATNQTVLIRVASAGATQPGPFILNLSHKPANDSCSRAFDVSAGGTFHGTLVNATNDAPVSSCGGAGIHQDVWFTYLAPAYAVDLSVDTCGTHSLPGPDAGLDSMVSVHTACPGGGAMIACNDDWTTAIPATCGADDPGLRRDSSLRVALSAGQRVYIRVSHRDSGAAFATRNNPFVLHVSAVRTDDDCADAVAVPVLGSIAFDTTGATTDGPTTGCPFAVENDLWFRYTALCSHGQDLTFSICGASFDTRMAIYAGHSCPVGAPLGCSDDSPMCAGPHSSVTVNTVANAPYLIRIGGAGGATGTGTLAVSCATPTGGCCWGTRCSVVTSAACAGLAGFYLGNGAACNAPGNPLAPCCLANFTRPGDLSVQDLFDFLAAYFAGNLAADINESGALSVQDIFDYVAAYFVGCP